MNTSQPDFSAFTHRACEKIKQGATKHSLLRKTEMNTGTSVQSFKETNPALFERLVDHPELRVVECYFQLESLQFHTLHYIAEMLQKSGFTADHISQAMKIYMET